ncbi:MAG: hypothetical protein ABEJ64_02700 [Candidatus Nanohaloarchaea archaeon]
MGVRERHRYAAATLTGMALLGEGALLYSASPVTVFYLTLLGGVAGTYFYAYSMGGEE